MKLLVIGHSVEDHISTDKDEIVKAGGIYYTASALTSIAPKDEIYLCTFAEIGNQTLFADVYSKCLPDFISYTKSIPKVLLTIHGAKEREERYQNVVQNLTVPFQRLKEFDGILINMVTGFDIDLDILKKIRQNFSGLIYLDVHTLSRGMGHHGDRNFKLIENFNEWAACVDIIQANEHEAKTLNKYDREEEIAREVLNSGTSQLIITKGQTGAKVYYLQKEEVNSIFQSAAKVDAENQIGLGDVFEAVYFYNYIKTVNIFNSLNAAINASGIAAGHDGLNRLKSL